MRTHYEIKLQQDTNGLWTAYRRAIVTPEGGWPLLIATGATLRDALDELALQLERERQEDDNAPR